MSILFRALDAALHAYIFLILLRVAWTWTEHFSRHPLVRRAWRPPFVYALRFLFAVVDPAVKPFRRYIPVGGGGMFLDMGPLILLLLVVLMKAGIQRAALTLP